MVDFVELSNKRTNSVRTIEELLVEFVPQTFKRCFQNFLLKANQKFVEILTTTYIFQSHKLNIGVVSGVISSTESESEESERFHFFRFRLRLRRL